MEIKDIMKIVETEEMLWEILKQYKVKKVKTVAEHVMSFILNSKICDAKLKKDYAKELSLLRSKRKKK